MKSIVRRMHDSASVGFLQGEYLDLSYRQIQAQYARQHGYRCALVSIVRPDGQTRIENKADPVLLG
jgi:hypothetical protein